MKKFLAGSIAVIIGIYFTSTYFTSMLSVLAGTVPLLLLLAGCLMIYMNYDCLFSGEKDPETGNPDMSHDFQSASETPEKLSEQEDLAADNISIEEPEQVDEIKPVEDVDESAEALAGDKKSAEPDIDEPAVTGTEVISETVSAIPEQETVDSVDDQPVENEAAEPEADVLNKDEGLIGNTGSLVFHKTGCQYAKSKKCTAIFDKRETFINEGYKPCGICKP